MTIALLLAALTGCGGPTTTDEAGELRLLTYNVHGLLPAITGDDTPARMRAISPMLGSFDVAAIQENFFNSEELMEDAPHAHAAHFHEVGEGRSTHSGLSVLSAIPILRQEGRAWERCHGVFDGASDCLGTKGTLFVRLQLGHNATLDLYDLHMEAGGGPDDIEARASNVEQLLAFIEVRSGPDRAVVVTGDFNLRPSDADDAPLLERLVEGGRLQEACALTDCPEPDHIDRFYLRSGDRVALDVVRWRRERQFVDSSGDALSDHPALSIGLGWRTR